MIRTLFRVLVLFENIRLFFDNSSGPNETLFIKDTEYSTSFWQRLTKEEPYLDVSTDKLWQYDDEAERWIQLNRLTYKEGCNVFSGVINNFRLSFSNKRYYR